MGANVFLGAKPVGEQGREGEVGCWEVFAMHWGGYLNAVLDTVQGWEDMLY